MIILIALLLLITSPVFATIRYVDITLASDCTSGNYSTSTRTCTGSDGNAYNTIAKGVTPTVAGDTLYLRGGAYPTNQRIDLQLEAKTGTAGNYITIGGFPGDSAPVLQYSEGGGLYGNIKARGNRGWFIFQDLVLDGANLGNGTYWAIRDGNHDIIVRRVEVKNVFGNGIYFDNVNNITVEDSYFHDSRSDCVVGNRWHGFYIHHGTNVTIQRNKVEAYHGIGFQLFPGPWDGVNIKNNVFYNNNHCVTVNNGGAVIFANSGNISNVNISGNTISHNGFAYGGQPGGAGGGLRILVGNGFNYSGVAVHNNVITDNTYNLNACTNTVTCVDHERGNAISILSGVTGVEIRNNILTGNTDASVVNYGTVTLSHNACLSGESCGATGKVSVTSVTDCLVSTSDLRLKQGTNVCRNAGTAVSTRPAPVGAVDIGAYEQGAISAAVVNDGIDVTMNWMTAPTVPTTGITGFTAACVGCSGSPTISSVSVPAGSSNLVHLVVSGITVAGTCTISLGPTNMTDSLFVGGTLAGTAQGPNSASAQTVTGTCANSGNAPPPSGVTAYYKLNEGSGSSANDETVNNNDGTVSSGITWETSYQGTGLRIPTDATYRHLDIPLGASTNMATAAGGTCAIVTLDSLASNKVVFSSGSNGSSQRLYYGVALVGGQLQWGIGIQGSGFTTGSEFVATTGQTSVCLQWGSGTATLYVNGVKGTGTGTSIKTYTSYTTTATNFRYGNDGVNTVNNGGFLVDEVVVWTSAVSDADVQAYHTDRFGATSAAACYSQANSRAQLIYIYGGSPVNYGPLGAIVEVQAGGSVAIAFQIDCTGSAGASVAVAPYYSTTIGGAFALLTPTSLGSDGVSMYGASNDGAFNAGTTNSNLSGGLTNVAGTTVHLFNVSPEVLLAQDRSQVLRYIFTFGDIPDQYRCFKLKQDNGQELAGGYTPSGGACVHIVQKASGGQ